MSACRFSSKMDMNIILLELLFKSKKKIGKILYTYIDIVNKYYSWSENCLKGNKWNNKHTNKNEQRL